MAAVPVEFPFAIFSRKNIIPSIFFKLIRSKSTSLAPKTRVALAEALSHAVVSLCGILEQNAPQGETAPQPFRDALACHLYMLYSFMFFLESDCKARSSTGNNNNSNKLSQDVLNMRTTCADAMLQAAEWMSKHKATLWQRGVADEAVLVLPCRIAYSLLEAATGVVARKQACGDQALHMIAVSVHQDDASLLNTVTAALMDLMHSFEHMAALTAELCTMTTDSRLAVELVREFGRLEPDAKSVGIKNVAPFVAELAGQRPRLVLQNLSHIVPHLNAEPYNLRSSIVTAISHILVFLGEDSSSNNANANQDPSTPGSNDEDSNSSTTNDGPTVQNLAKSRAALLDLLSERAYDVTSFTRAAVIKAWIRLVQTQSIPKERIVPVTRLAMDRLQDKTVMVRKQSMQLLTALLENNPWTGSLAPEPYRAKLGELYTFVKEHMPADLRRAQEASAETAADDDDDDNNNDAINSQQMEHAALAAAIAEADTLLASADDLTEQQKEYCSKVQALKFTQSALDFIEIFEDATKSLEGMLLSANTSDVTEALRFFVQARHFQLPCAITGMKRALALMWSQESSIRDEVLKAFVDVFIAVPGTEGSQLLPNDDIAKNLLVLTGQASVSELASIEEAIIRLVKEERMPDDIFLILWSIASKGTCETRAAALQLLSMGAGADRSIIDSKSRLKLLLDAGLGEMTRETNNWKLAGASAIALQRIARAEVDPSDAKYLVLERIIEELCTICRGEWCNDEDENDTLQWFSAAEQAIKALFVISPEPEVACKEIITGIYNTTFRENSAHSLRLARFFHVLGQIALNLLVYTEALTSSVRRGNAKRSLKKQEEADRAKAKKRNSRSHEDDEDDAIEAELGVAAQAEAENERRLADISEHEIVGRNLISMFGPLLIRVVGNEGGKFNSEILMQASTLALCKFMSVSGSFCEKHLPLLFTALGSAPSQDTTMRANTVVALGDLAFRFPNEVEPYTPRLYACLRDSSTKVRRHTLMVLTHLILNDMIKVKGQVSEIAMCLRDDDPRIRDMSRLLFHELSKRSNNPIYNLLPEIISQLSQLSTAKDDFRSIMSFLLGYIKKEKQNEMLTEKLCLRFPKCTTISQSADLAYCIAQLKLSEKAIKCLSDNFNLYKDCLFDEDVNKSFSSIVSKAKKVVNKPERRQLLEEWEAKLDELANTGAENQRASEKAAKAKKRATRRAARKKQREIIEEEDELEFPDEDEEEEEEESTFEDDAADKENSGRSRRSSRRMPAS